MRDAYEELGHARKRWGGDTGVRLDLMNVGEVIFDLSRPTTHSARYHTRQWCLKRSRLWQEQYECLLGRIAVAKRESAPDSNSPLML